MAAASQPLPDPKREYDSRADMVLGKRALLHSIFYPKTVGVIGATDQPGSLGHKVLSTLLGSPFDGTVFAVAPEQGKVLGIQAYPAISAVPVPVDLAVLVASPDRVPDLVDECAQAQVKGAIVVSDGFGEHHRDSDALEQRIAEKLRGSRMRLIGPGRTGVIIPATGLNASSRVSERKQCHRRRRPGVEPEADCGLQRVCIRGRHVGRGLGRLD